jgi:hybrid polyketide synthase/nonribosomal peptide synthetase ACE1
VAELSQPLCTVIQIILVDMLRIAGITFVAVAGHSSGEIAAAYAADFISAHDAVRIAYYRGFHAKLARGPDGQHKGAMLAVGLSWEDANELSEQPAFQGRITLAAHNSAASVTMSGDLDAIMLAKSFLDERKQFSRLLKVQAAYHSHHMLPCSDPYLQSLRACKIRVNQERDTSCSWYSSVAGGEVMSLGDEVQNTYWVENMAKPVLFMEAITNAAQENVNLVLEVGPHPALKGPTTQTLSDVRASLPYSGVLNRGDDDIEAFADCLGFIWMQLGGAAVNFDSFNKTLTPGSCQPKLLTGLPRYQWDHQQVHWHESRHSKKARNRSEPFHELLGVKSPDSTGRDWRWTNILKANEIPWLNGHKLQGQTVFPAAGYVAMALEAAKKLARGKEVKLFEVSNLVISRAITFEDEPSFAVETLVTLTAISSSSQNQDTQSADFACYSCSNVGSGDLEQMASACVKVIFGDSLPKTLTSTRLEVEVWSMSPIDRNRFYSSLLDLGYGYTASFEGLSSLRRKLDQASAMVSTYPYEKADDVLMVHPTTLDVAFQALLLAQSTPGDQRLWSLHIPSSISRILVNPSFCTSLPISGTTLPVNAVLQESESIAVCGNVDISSEDGQQTFIQVEGLTLAPFSPATAADDRRLFSYTKWDVAEPNGAEVVGTDHPSAEEVELAVLCERLSYYYLKKWMSEITDEEWTNGEWHHQRLQESTNHLLSVVASGQHPCVKKEWQDDTEDQIKDLISKYVTRLTDPTISLTVCQVVPKEH